MSESQSETKSLLEHPVYRDRRRRKIANTKAVAVTMYQSSDLSVHEVAVFTMDGTGFLGHAHFHPARSIFHRHWCAERVCSWGQGHEPFDSLATFAVEMAKRNGLEA